MYNNFSLFLTKTFKTFPQKDIFKKIGPVKFRPVRAELPEPCSERPALPG